MTKIRRKKILFSSYMHGNMEALIDYYNTNILSKGDRGNVEIVYLDFSKIEAKKKFLRYASKYIEYHKKYDLVLTDYASPILSTGDKIIFMDHGYGLKTMPGKDDLLAPKAKDIVKLVKEKSDYIITLSERDEEYFYKVPEVQSFNKPKYLPLGQPRNDVLFHEEFIKKSRSSVINSFNLKKESKIILYAPTWRGYDAINSFPLKRKDFEDINDYMSENGWVLLYRPHYIENLITDDLIVGLNNIIVADVHKEPYTQKLLGASDMVITDYSSIFVDFLIKNKPVAFIPFDKEKYDDYRGLVVDFNNKVHVPGPEITCAFDLVSYLNNLDKGLDKYTEIRESSIKYYFNYFDGNSCERIWKLIYKIL